MNRVAFHTLGCKLNFAESSTIGRQFLQRGFTVVDFGEPADVCVINTCSVTERADRECRQIVRRALRRSPDAYVVIVGCYAQLQPSVLAEIEGVDLVLGSKEKFDLFSYAGRFEKSGTSRVAVSPIEEVHDVHAASSIGFSDRTRAFLKIQDGCDCSCAFCTIPLARGASRSVTIEESLNLAREIVAQGYREIVLTGVNVGDYGKKMDSSLLMLLKELVGIDGLERIRISSIEPNLLTDELLEFWLSSSKVCPHCHIPLQGGSDELLRQMRRRYKREWYTNRVERIKEQNPHACIGVDVIAGFPGESDALFEETYRYLAELPISYLHVFTYSERPNTPAVDFTQRVEPRIRHERSERLRILSVKKRRAFYESFVGSTVNVLFEGPSESGNVSGLTPEYVRVRVPGSSTLVNQIREVRVLGVEDEDCFGELIDSSDAVAERCTTDGVNVWCA